MTPQKIINKKKNLTRGHKKGMITHFQALTMDFSKAMGEVRRQQNIFKKITANLELSTQQNVPFKNKDGVKVSSDKT